MSSSSDVVPVVLEEEAAPPPEWLAWGTSPKLYLSYGMVAKKGMAPALTAAVAAAASFTVLSPPMGLDFFAVLDGRDRGAANAGDEPPVRLLSLLQNAIAEQINMELFSDKSPRFGDATSRSRDNVVAWWATTLREAFRAFHGEPGMDDVGAKAIVALVLEKYLVIGNCGGGGGSKAVLCRDGGELVELSSDHMANSRGDENKKSVHKAGEDRVTKDTTKGVAVDVVAVEREAQDEFLILGTAALWDKVTPAAACAHVRRRLGRASRVTMPWEPRITDAQGSPTLLATELARKAVQAGSKSNVSVGLVVFRDFWAAGHAHGPQTAADK